MAIISFSRRFVFLKTRKVAGTSVEALIRPYLGSEDIVPAVTPRDEFYCANQGAISRNYLARAKDESRYTELVLDGRFEEAASFLRGCKKRASSHMTYSQIERLIEKNGHKIRDFWVFTIDRHPYSWLISQCLYSNKKYNSGSLDVSGINKEEINRRVGSFLTRMNIEDVMNWGMYAKNGEVVVDDVLKYEKLNEGMAYVLNKLDININPRLPKLKNNAKHIDAFSVLNSDVKDEAYKIFYKTFRYLGYSR